MNAHIFCIFIASFSFCYKTEERCVISKYGHLRLFNLPNLPLYRVLMKTKAVNVLSRNDPLIDFYFNLQKLHARAIYDNIADSPEELAFKKGDILNVIEQDPDGLIGWWLCTLRGRQVI